MPKPVCFMLMPHGRKKTDAAPGQGPGGIDFDALWDRALRPAIVELGYDPVRAGQAARRHILYQGSTWGAYQHYGQATDALMRLARRSG